MYYWNSILDEVLHKDESAQAFLYTNNGRMNDLDDFSVEEDFPVDLKESRDLRTYYLGDNYPDVYFTKREAETLFWIIQGLTIAQAARKMQLSARTAEFYVKKMKFKLSCTSKKELVDKVVQTDLLQQLEKSGLRVVKH